MKVLFESKRLEFCLWDLSRPDSFIQLCSRPGISEFGSETYQDLSRENALRFIAMQVESFKKSGTGKFAIRLTKSEELIGISGIFEMDPPHNGKYEINYRFAKESWGKGFGREAADRMIEYGFTSLNLSHIYASVEPTNARSKRLLTKIGMTPIDQGDPKSGEELWVKER